jgi:deoxycytidylate deaminase
LRADAARGAERHHPGRPARRQRGGATIYVTHQPCLTCAKMIINAGIKRVVYAGHYPDENAVAFLRDAGVELQHWSAPPQPELTDENNEPAN